MVAIGNFINAERAIDFSNEVELQAIPMLANPSELRQIHRHAAAFGLRHSPLEFGAKQRVR